MSKIPIYVIYNDDRSIFKAYESEKAAKRYLLELIGIESKDFPDSAFIVKTVSISLNDSKYSSFILVDLPYVNQKEKSTSPTGLINNDWIMYHGPRGYYPDEMDFLQYRVRDENDKILENE